MVIGLGGTVAAGGVIVATGAFDTVEAQRSFEVDVAGDHAALLGLEVHNDAIAGTEEGGAGGNDIIFFALDDDEVEETAINENAITEFYAVFTITNNGSQDDVLISIDTGTVDGVTFMVRENPQREPPGVTNSDIVNQDVDLEEDAGVELDPGETVSVDLIIDTTDDGGYVQPSNGPYDMTILANSPDAQN